jgi:FkbM family methyltransferase
VARLPGLELLKPIKLTLDGSDRAPYVALSDKPISLILDIGANVGLMAQRLSYAFPDAAVHCFEPIASTYEKLRERVSENHRIHTWRTAMGSHVGTVSMEYTGQSLTNRVSETVDDEVVSLTTVDAFCATHGITAIDILKSDTEGYELQVLHGADRMLGSTRFLLVEYGLAAGDTQHTHLEELLALLAPRGFRLVNAFETVHDTISGCFVYGNALFFHREH